MVAVRTMTVLMALTAEALMAGVLTVGAVGGCGDGGSGNGDGGDSGGGRQELGQRLVHRYGRVIPARGLRVPRSECGGVVEARLAVVAPSPRIQFRAGHASYDSWSTITTNFGRANVLVVVKIRDSPTHDALGTTPSMVEARVRVELADGQLHHAPQPFLFLADHFALLVLGRDESEHRLAHLV